MQGGLSEMKCRHVWKTNGETTVKALAERLSNYAGSVELCAKTRLLPCKDGEYNTNCVTIRHKIKYAGFGDRRNGSWQNQRLRLQKIIR